MTNADRVARAARAIAGARLSLTPLAVLPQDFRPRDEAEAYAVQEAVHGLIAASRFGARVGHKIGCTTRVMQDYMGIRSPCAGGVFAGGVHRSGVTVPFDAYLRVGVECEIAARIGDDDEVSAYMAAIEIVDDRYADWRSTDTPTLIADDFFAAGCVLGPPIAPADVGDAAELVGSTTVNGVEAGRGRGRDVLGHPLNALNWLDDRLRSHGRTLAAGEIVLLGSLVETVWLDRGDRAVIDIDRLGEVTMTAS